MKKIIVLGAGMVGTAMAIDLAKNYEVTSADYSLKSLEKIKYKQSNINLENLLIALKNGDINQFIKIVENEALSLHSMMMLSEPSFILLKPKTLEVISDIRRYRNKTKIPVCFTLDAGPNIHLLYPNKYHAEIQEFKSKIKKVSIITDSLGNGIKNIVK